MNGAGHYRMAEKLLSHGDDLAPVALVHAVLALAAATALNDGEAGMQEADFKAWHLAAGAVKP